MAAQEGWYLDEGISAAMADEGLEDMSSHFLPRHKPWLKDGRTWAMHRSGREVHSWPDYILVTDSCLFQNVSVQDARHNTYHYLVLGCLRGDAPAAHSRYLGRRTRFLIRSPETPDKSDRMFAELW